MLVVLRSFIADSPVSAYCLDILISGWENKKNKCFWNRCCRLVQYLLSLNRLFVQNHTTKKLGELNSGNIMRTITFKTGLFLFSSQMNFIDNNSMQWNKQGQY